MNFLQKRFIKAVLEEDFDWLKSTSEQLSNHLKIEHNLSFKQMEHEITDFIDGKRKTISHETKEFTSVFLIYDAKYLEQISKKVGPRFVVWILSRLLLFSSRPAWTVLVNFEKQLRPEKQKKIL